MALPSQSPEIGRKKDLRETAVLAALQRQVDHIHRHARDENWPAMLAAIDRLGAVADSERQRGTSTAAVVQDFVARALTGLRGHFAEIQDTLDVENERVRSASHRLRAARHFRPKPSPSGPSRRLNATA